MAMLAETRKKQKWTLNPRGSAWVNDSSKFGEKLLRKMGWSDGQGLGVKQQGITEHIKVRVKHDSKGLGFKENDQVWVEVENDFSNLLSKLASHSEKKTESDSSIPNESVNRSLEEQSKKSKARVHYQKFTRGKDLSRYSKKDLESIFGVSSKTAESRHEENKNFVPSGNMNEYFSKKLSNKSSKAETKTYCSNSTEEAVQKNESIKPDDIEEQEYLPKKKNKKAKKRKHKEIELDMLETEPQEVENKSNKKKDSRCLEPVEILEKKTKKNREISNIVETKVENSEGCKNKTKKKKKKRSKAENILIHQMDGTYDSSEVEEFLMDPNKRLETSCNSNIQQETNNKKVNIQPEGKQLIRKLNTKPKSLDKVISVLAASTEMKDAVTIKVLNEEVSKNVDAIVQAKINNYLSQVFNRKDKITSNPVRELKEKKKKMVQDDESCVQFNGSNICYIPGYGCY